MTALGTRFPSVGLPRLVRRLWRWWTAELVACIPAVLRQRRTAYRLRVADDGQTGALVRVSGGQHKVLTQVSMSAAAPATMPDQVPPAPRRRAIARRFGSRATRIRVRLPASQALRTTFTLPEAVTENLGRVLSFELDRRTPFSPQEACFGYRVEERVSAGMIRVAIAVVPRRVVAAAGAAVHRLGGELDLVEVDGGDGPPMTLRTDVDEDSVGRLRNHRRRLRIVLIGLIALAAAAGLSQLHRGAATIDALRRAADAARAQATEVRRLTDQIARLRSERDYLLARHQRRVPVNGILDRLSALLPDDTWLVAVRISADSIQFGGYSKSSSNLIQLLAASKLFEAPRFASPVTRDDQFKRERFTITAKLIRGGDK